MSVGLVIGIIVAVIALCIAVSFATRKWTIRKILKDRRSTTQIYVLPPPVQARSAGSTESIRAETPFLASISENPISRHRSLSDALSVTSDRSSNYFTEAPSQIAELPAFTSLPTTPVSDNTRSVPFTPLTPMAVENDKRASMSFAHVPSRTPGIVKAKTFRSEVIELGRSRASTLGSIISPRTPGGAHVPAMPPMPEMARSQTGSISEMTGSLQALSPANSVPRRRQRAMSLVSRAPSSVSSLGATEVSSLTGGIVSPATGTFSIMDTPVIGTAVAFDFRTMRRPDDDIPPVPTIPSIAHVGPMYLPYRPTPCG